jgi:hypothetical protein
LISEESNSAQDIFVHDLETGITTRVSSPLYDYDSIWYFNTPSISGDGRYVAFQFFEEALNPYDEEYYLNATGVLYQDRMTLETTTVYRTAVDFQLHNPSISADGNYVAYEASEDSGYEIFVQGPMINEPLTVTIDIAPRREPNRIIPDRGRPAVAILTDQSFDATQVDPASVRFGPAQAEPMSNRIIDVDSDGDMDQVFYFLTEQTGIACGDTEATLIGETFEGVSVSGSDAIITLGCR